jgi:hypothetical protein
MLQASGKRAIVTLKARVRFKEEIEDYPTRGDTPCSAQNSDKGWHRVLFPDVQGEGARLQNSKPPIGKIRY